MQVHAGDVRRDLPGRPFRDDCKGMRSPGIGRAPRPETGRLLAGGFSLDTGGRIGLFRSEYPAGNDRDEPAAPVRGGRRDPLPGIVRAHLSREPEAMSQDRGITPWVGRLMVVNATVLLLLQTVFTAPAFVDLLQFAPAQAATRPWTFLSYMFVHGGLLHLAGNMLLLFVFGPPVERRMGGGAFLLYYLYCGVGAAAFALGLAPPPPGRPLVR